MLYIHLFTSPISGYNNAHVTITVAKSIQVSIIYIIYLLLRVQLVNLAEVNKIRATKRLCSVFG